MNNELPSGFIELHPDIIPPRITFDKIKKRFYFGRAAQNRLGIKPTTRVGLAYNPIDNAVLVDLKGKAFYVDVRGYVGSSDFSSRVEIAFPDVKSLHFLYADEMSSERFKVFRPVD